MNIQELLDNLDKVNSKLFQLSYNCHNYNNTAGALLQKFYRDVFRLQSDLKEALYTHDIKE